MHPYLYVMLYDVQAKAPMSSMAQETLVRMAAPLLLQLRGGRQAYVWLRDYSSFNFIGEQE